MTADEMFKDLGYEKIVEDRRIIIYKNIQHFTTFEIKNGMLFYKTDKQISLKSYNLTDDIPIDFCLNMQELKAINKKVEELGW